MADREPAAVRVMNFIVKTMEEDQGAISPVVRDEFKSMLLSHVQTMFAEMMMAWLEHVIRMEQKEPTPKEHSNGKA